MTLLGQLELRSVHGLKEREVGLGVVHSLDSPLLLYKIETKRSIYRNVSLHRFEVNDRIGIYDFSEKYAVACCWFPKSFLATPCVNAGSADHLICKYQESSYH